MMNMDKITIRRSVRWIAMVMLMVCGFFAVGCAAIKETIMPERPLTANDFQFYRHSEIKTGRPFAFDVDDNGWLWQGNTGEFWVHDTNTGKAMRVAPPELKGLALSAVICFQGKLVVVHQVCDHATIYDPVTQKTTKLPLPGKKPNVWSGIKAGGKLLLFDRSDDGGVLILDSLDAPGPGFAIRKIPATDGRFPVGGRVTPDGRVWVGTYPTRSVSEFDLASETFVREILYPNPDAALGTFIFHEGKIYSPDTTMGLMHVYDEAKKQWVETIPVPDQRKVFGFIGGGFQHGSVGYFCLSTYAHHSKLDPATGKLILPPNSDIGVDGQPHHFLDRFLTFDAATRKFGYLTAPPQRDGYPLLCYSRAKGDSIILTGYVIPFDAQGNLAKELGDWIVWQRR